MNGKGGHLVIDERCTRLGAIDDKRGVFIDSGIDLKAIKRGWHNVFITCDNS